MGEESDSVDSLLRSVAAAPSVRPPLRAGDRLGDRYVIEAYVGAGGMGSVYRALDEKLGEHVALKLVKAGLDEAMLRDEVRLAQKVTHPNVCRTFDLEEVDDRTFVKMELVPGETLVARIARGALPITDALAIARAIAAGLAAAHAKDIVHSDLKPGNVMLDGERVVLMDFGVAHFSAAPGTGSQGTGGYIAPEKLRGQPGDARGDLYALGCVLYEMLAGERVYAGNAVEVAARHVGDPVPDVRAKRSDVPRWLARATTHLLAKDPAHRKRGIAELAGPSRARPLAAIAGVLLVGGATAAWLLHRPAWAPAIVDLPAYQENIGSLTISPDGEWIAMTSDRDGRQDHVYLISRQTGVAMPLALDKDNGSAKFAPDGSLYVIANDEDRPSVVKHVTFSKVPLIAHIDTLAKGEYAEPCGDDVLIVDATLQGSTVTSFNRKTVLFRSTPDHVFVGVHCDHQGRTFAVLNFRFGESGDIFIVDRTTGEARQLTTDETARSTPTFTPDGTALVVARRLYGETRMHLWKIYLDGRPSIQLTFGDADEGETDISADGRTLLFWRDHGAIRPSLVTNDKTEDLTRQELYLDHLRPFGSDAVVGERLDRGMPEIAVFSLTTHMPESIARGRLPFSANDQQHVYFANERDRHLLERVDASTRAVDAIAWLPGVILGGCDSPDGVHVLVAIDRARHEYRVDHGTIHDEHSAGLICGSPDGRHHFTLFSDTAQFGARLVIDDATTIPNASLAATWKNARVLTYCRAGACVEHDVESGVVTEVAHPAFVGGILAVELPDGRVINATMHGSTTLHLLTNIADR
ncbi:MAG: protein kinase [Kofleriaceae bacterium]